jgi:site-specific DNA-methyltransferase (adenine-specific)
LGTVRGSAVWLAMISSRRTEVKVAASTLRSWARYGPRVSVGEMSPAPTIASTSLGTLFAGDALVWLTSLPEASVDLVFADPPYNLGRERWDTIGSASDYVDWSRSWITQAARILRPTGSLFICGFSELLADVKVVATPLFESCRWLVWYYRNKANLGRDWGRSHESILHLRGSRFVLDVDAARIPYNSHTVRYPAHPQAKSSRYGRKQYVWRPNPLGAKPRDVIEIPTLTNGMREKTLHPTQKPLELVRRLVAAASRPGDLVVDPFGGSGTTFVACEALGRRWFGCEIDPRFQAVIVERLSETVTIDTAAQAEDRRRAQRRKLR